jgi:rhodanese-related sulfurtransferase
MIVKKIGVFSVLFCVSTLGVDLLSISAHAASPSRVDEIKPQAFYRAASQSPPKEMSAKRLAALLKKNAVILIDLRAQEAFASGHIQGAINVPIDLLTSEALKDIAPKQDATIVVYCQNTFMPTRMIALTTLGYPEIEQLGYTNVYRLEDLWRAKACQAGIKSKALDRTDGVCPTLLPMQATGK